MGATTEEFAELLVELTDQNSDFGEDMTVVEDGTTAASFGIGTTGNVSAVYDPASGGYVAAVPVEGGPATSPASIETPFRGILLDVVKQPRVSDEAVQAGIATVVCPSITRADATVLQPLVGMHVRTVRGNYQILAVSPVHVQGGTAGWELVLGA